MKTKSHFFCHRDGLKIKGTVFLPEDHAPEKLPIAIVCHEFMANRLFSYPYKNLRETSTIRELELHGDNLRDNPMA